METKTSAWSIAKRFKLRSNAQEALTLAGYDSKDIRAILDIAGLVEAE